MNKFLTFLANIGLKRALVVIISKVSSISQLILVDHQSRARYIMDDMRICLYVCVISFISHFSCDELFHPHKLHKMCVLKICFVQWTNRNVWNELK